MRAAPSTQPAVSKTRPKASADATPEQNTKISVASLKPKRAGIQSAHGFVGICAIRMMNIPKPRKKSSRGSRGRSADSWGRMDMALRPDIRGSGSSQPRLPQLHDKSDDEPEDDVA